MVLLAQQPIAFLICCAAVEKAACAGVAPEPFVELTHASPRDFQTEPICGMFGSGTPPLLAAPN